MFRLPEVLPSVKETRGLFGYRFEGCYRKSFFFFVFCFLSLQEYVYIRMVFVVLVFSFLCI